MGIVERYLQQLNNERKRIKRSAAKLALLSLIVVIGVSWNLRITGITMANNACCGFIEHQHSEDHTENLFDFHNSAPFKIFVAKISFHIYNYSVFFRSVNF